jgi:hypothetical protein
VAAAILSVTDDYMTASQVHFSMRWIGYRYAVGSVNAALNRAYNEGLCIAFSDGTYAGRLSAKGQRAMARALCFPRRSPAFYVVMKRLAKQVASARREHARRVAA